MLIEYIYACAIMMLVEGEASNQEGDFVSCEDRLYLLATPRPLNRYWPKGKGGLVARYGELGQKKKRHRAARGRRETGCCKFRAGAYALETVVESTMQWR